MKNLSPTPTDYLTRPEITLADLVQRIESTNTVNAGIQDGNPFFEFTSPEPPIMPVCIVHGRWEDGDWRVQAEAGPGQDISTATLLACEIVARRRIKANRQAARALAVHAAAVAIAAYSDDKAGLGQKGDFAR